MTLKVGDTIKGVASQTEYTVVYVLAGAGNRSYVIQDKNGVDYFTTQPKNYVKVTPDTYPNGTVLGYPEESQPDRILYFKDGDGDWYRLSGYAYDRNLGFNRKVTYDEVSVNTTLVEMTLVPKKP